MSNRTVLSGRLTHEPELKTTADGTEVLSFRIAVPKPFKRDEADFFDIVAWRKTAVFVAQYFRKGDGIEVDGRLQTRQYQAKDGTNRTVVKVVADNVSFPPGKGKQQETADEVPSVTPVSGMDELNRISDEAPTPDGGDDLPF